MGSQNDVVTYVGKARRPKAGGGGFTDWCDYIFKVQGYRTEARVGITCHWHDVISPLGRTLTDEELIAITKEFLEGELARSWTPWPEGHSVDITSDVMDSLVHKRVSPG
jgi:hypothetical protein